MTDVLAKIAEQVNAAPKNMEVLEWLFGDRKNDALSGTPVVLYGTGNLGKDFLLTLKNLGLNTVCFCNSDPSKSGQLFCDIPIISINELKEFHRHSIILIATQTHAASVKKDLIDRGFARERVLWPKDFDMALGLYFSYANQSVLSFLRARDTETLKNVLLANEEKISSVYNMLADEKSRELFVTKLAFMVCNENLALFLKLMLEFAEPIFEFGLIPFPNLGPENHFYFTNDVFALSKGEVFIDVGAYDGDSVTAFTNACYNNRLDYMHIYAFEPDPTNFESLTRNTAGVNNISYHKMGVWDREETLRFQSSEEAFSTTASGIADTGNIEVSVVGLDAFLNGREVTLIKMDPPGEVIQKALIGAHKTITKYKPKLILNAYNTFEDIFEIPYFVGRHWPDYKIYLRHISWTICETDLFAYV